MPRDENAALERDRLIYALKLADRYFTREDERDRGEGGAGIYGEMRRAIRAALRAVDEEETDA